MIATATVALLLAGALGWGLALERWAGIPKAAAERLTRALILGFGLLGWLGFFIALGQRLDPLTLASIPVLGLPGLLRLRHAPTPRAAPTEFGPWTWALVAVIAALVAGDVLEGLSPPADADSMAYHFASPKLFLRNGGLFFIPRASDGAAPLLPQMTYMLALGLGGERAMTLWCMASGWFLPLATFAYGRRHLSRDWALAAAAVVMSLPAVLYGAGSGQVETRVAAFVLVSAFAAVDALRTRSLRAAMVAGLAAGLFLAAKFIGLLFVAAVGLVLLAGPGWLARALVFAAAALAAGSQWYAWNWWNTGDPVFPMLFGLLPYKAGVPWSADQAEYLRTTFFAAEKAVPQTLLWWLAYPVRVLVDSNDTFEAGRTGLGPFPLLAAPFALAGAWRFRERLKHSPLLPLTAIAILFYTLWFFLGTSQRVRFHLPVVPLAVIAMLAAAQAGTRGRASRPALVAAIIATLGLQLGAQGILALNYGRRLLAGEDRAAFMARNLPAYSVVTHLNATLGRESTVLTGQRELIYLFDIPVFYGHPHVEARIDLRDTNTDWEKFWRQLQSQRITHVLLGPFPEPDSTGAAGLVMLTDRLVAEKCGERTETLETTRLASRALRSAGTEVPVYYRLIRLTPSTCPIPAR